MRRPLIVVSQLILLAGLLVGGWWVVGNRNQLLDWYYLRNYTPPARIAQLATQTTMSEEGRRLFYRADPAIDSDRRALAGHCHIQDSDTIELGCYLSTDKIYLLDIPQPELAIQMPVTAAHEMLHAGYDRLGSAEKRRINQQLEATAKRLNDPKLNERLGEYDRIEPGQHDNELHSILGSEYGQLPPELEEYYRRYFSNRATVVAASAQFDRTFDGLHAEIETLDERIKATRQRMDGLLARGQISSYNALVPSINQDITTYNAKVDQYNRYASVLMGRPTAQPVKE
jgi:hypothetical protein